MIILSLLTSFIILPFATAQSNDANIQFKAIEAHFTQSQIVPSLLPTFDPSALLIANYPGLGDVTPGQKLTKEQSSPTPTITVTPANSSVTLDGRFTIAMVDADVVGSDLSKGVNRHWLVNSVSVTGTYFIDNNVSFASGTAITAYAGPGPAAGSGPHRYYVIILYTQPESFAAPPGFIEPIGVTLFDVIKYAKDSGLGPIVAATYITVEDGTATASIPPTSAVISSTLIPSSTSASGDSPNVTVSTGSGEPTGTSKNSSVIKLGRYSLFVTIIVGITTVISAQSV
ncbi:phosphatidylethanolamine-binding protein [Collybia nuda]|uniref:Phosphatidylethanolamine-binding protein n=1 Tax=Collybia nuda TaxID=64659 RepID=A0A9P5Y1E2_9AGAR|nr:phosphatidylethanolamine-binding protein [Collybia nuda]